MASMKKIKKNGKKITKKVGKKPVIIAAVGVGAVAVGVGLGKAIKSMKQNAKAQHEVDKAEFAAAKAEAKANFEENRGKNTYAKAKADAKKAWDDAHMSVKEREAAMQAERDERIEAANQRKAEAEARMKDAKSN